MRWWSADTCIAGVEDSSHSEDTDDTRYHDLVAGDTRIDEDASPDEDSERGDFTYRAWEEAEEGIPVGERATERIVDVGEHTLSSSDLPEGRSTREAVDSLLSTTEPEGRAEAYPHAVTRHSGGVREEEEGTRDQRYVEDVVARTTEDFLSEDHSEGSSYSDHPQWGLHRDNHRDENPRDEEPFLDLLMLHLGDDEFNTQTYSVGDDDLRQHGEEAIEEGAPEGSLYTYGDIVLQPDVVHPEEQRRQESEDDYAHRALAIDGIVDVSATTLRGRIGYEEERLKAVED